MYVTTLATSLVESADFHGGIVPLKVAPFTWIAPVLPFSTVRITCFGSPVTNGLPASGGKAADPAPAAPWHELQFCV